MSGQKRIIKHFPHFFQTGDTENLFYRFVEVFGSMLDDAENDLVRVMRSHWVDTADNEGSKGLDTNQKGDLDKIFALYIEALGGTSLLRQIDRRDGPEGLEDDAVYRERMKRLILILKEGASTRNGIIAIIAANLGIHGDSPKAVAARALIEIEEYLPRPMTTDAVKVGLFETFPVRNPNPETTKVEIRISLDTPVPHYQNVPDFQLINLEVIELTTKTSMKWVGGNIDATVKHKLLISSEGVFLDDVPSDNMVTFPPGNALDLPPGVSQWQIRSTVGIFSDDVDNNNKNDSGDEDINSDPNRFFDQAEVIFAPSEQMFTVTFTFVKLQPATFMVRIPWDIPGYTKLLDAQPDQPRLQIPYIVNRVKAAGVWAVVAYYKTLTETQEMTETPHDPIIDDPAYQDNQDMSDNFYFGGVFDVTQYDQSLFQ